MIDKTKYVIKSYEKKNKNNIYINVIGKRYSSWPIA